MNSTQLAYKVLRYQEMYDELQCMAREIEEAVVKNGATLKIARTTVSYSGGTRKFDYEAAADTDKRVTPEILEAHTTIETVTKVDYRTACEEAGLNKEKDIPFTKSEPSAKIKVG